MAGLANAVRVAVVLCLAVSLSVILARPSMAGAADAWISEPAQKALNEVANEAG